MLSVSKYDQDYIDQCRATTGARMGAYRALASDGGSGVADFEPVFFNTMLLALDHLFCHRGRTNEGKDGNPLNEVRVLCNSIMENEGIMAADKQIRLKPDASVLGYEVGDEIRLSEADFRLLSGAFLAEIEAKYR
jgi:hypothetical protein